MSQPEDPGDQLAKAIFRVTMGCFALFFMACTIVLVIAS